MASVGMCMRFVRCLTEIRHSPHCHYISKSHLCRAMTNSASAAKPEDPEKPAENSQASASEAPSKTDLEKELSQAKEKLAADLESLNDKYKRSLAETENVRQRLQKQISDAKIFGIQGFCKDLLEVADVLGKATESVPKEELESNTHLRHLFDGLKMTESQLLKVFGKHGLSQINPINEKFDPNFHEALFEIPTPDKDPGTVAVVQKIGYKLHERTIRPALVGVSKAVS